MSRLIQTLLVLGVGATLTACARQPPAPAVSEEGRRLCRERMASQATVQLATQAYRECLNTIDAELAEARRSRPLEPEPPEEEANPERAYFHCLSVRDRVAEAREQRLRAQPRWIVASRLPPDDPRYGEAQQAYQAAMADLERLIPVELRGGKPLVPDGEQEFIVCDRAQLKGR